MKDHYSKSNILPRVTEPDEDIGLEEADIVDHRLPIKSSSRTRIYPHNLSDEAHLRTETDGSAAKLARSSGVQTTDELPSPVRKYAKIIIRNSGVKDQEVFEKQNSIQKPKPKVRVSVQMKMNCHILGGSEL
jgi:hypothetical protein